MSLEKFAEENGDDAVWPQQKTVFGGNNPKFAFNLLLCYVLHFEGL